MYIHHVSVRVYFPRRASRIKAFLLPLIGIRKEDRNSRAHFSFAYSSWISGETATGGPDVYLGRYRYRACLLRVGF